jgi:hypothetical protein
MGSTLTTLKWSLDDYHRMIEAGILGDRRAGDYRRQQTLD